MKNKWMAGVLGAALAIGVPVFAQSDNGRFQQSGCPQAAPTGHASSSRKSHAEAQPGVEPDG